MAWNDPHDYTGTQSVNGLFYNSSPNPTYLEDTLVGGHEWVYAEGILRIPGQFVLMDDPEERENPSEDYRRAYEQFMEAGRARSKAHHPSSRVKSTVVAVESTEEENEAPADAEPSEESEENTENVVPINATRRSRTSKKGKRETVTDTDTDQ
jgi:hypothetical protein